MASRLSEQMDEQVIDWLSNNTKGVAFDAAATEQGSGSAITISRIFLWFRDDFPEKDPVVFIRRVHPMVPAKPSEVKFFNYNWNLNAVANAGGDINETSAFAAASE